MYRAITVGYAPKAKRMAEEIEAKANEMEKKGYALVSITETGSGKAVLVFHTEIEHPDTDEAAEL